MANGILNLEIMCVANGNAEDDEKMEVREGLCAYCANYVIAKRKEGK